MEHCRYCRKEISPGRRACEDCVDYEAAVRVADHVLRDSNIESGALEAALGAEIMREYFLRSLKGARARRSAPPLSEQPSIDTLRSRALL